MSMKYIKLFESWKLMEAKGKQDSFDMNNPDGFPILQTTIGDLKDAFESGKGGDVLTSIIKRAMQSGGKWNPKAGDKIGYVDFYEEEPTSDIKVFNEETMEQLFPEYEINAKQRVVYKALERGGFWSLVPRESGKIKINLFDKFIKDLSAMNQTQILNVLNKEKNLNIGGGFDKNVLIKVLNKISENLKAKEKDKASKPKIPSIVINPQDEKSFPEITFSYVPFDDQKLEDSVIDLKLEELFNITIDNVSVVDPFPVVKKGQFTLGMVMTFLNNYYNKGEFKNSLLSKTGFNNYKDDLKLSILSGEEAESLTEFAATLKIGGQNLKLANGENGTIVPLYVATDVMGTCGFDFNKATLKEDAKNTLSKKELWAILTNAKTSIEIIGHTDSVGKEEVNMTLSKQRAESVLKFLQGMKDEFQKITQKKIKVTTAGMGFKEMVVDDKGGKDKDAAAKNRRVVIKVDGVGPDYKALFK